MDQPIIESWAVILQAPPEYCELISELLLEDDHVVCEKEPGLLAVYLPEEPTYLAWQQRLETISTALGIETIHFEIEPIAKQDWVALTQESDFCYTIGQYCIYDMCYKGKKPKAAIDILINAQISFGTGNHPTTQGCLELIDYLSQQTTQFNNMLDIGCGSGILSVALAKTWPGNIIATDIKSTAIENCNENLTSNQVTSQVTPYIADGLNHPAIAESRPYDLICANILASILQDLAPSLPQYSKAGGLLILSGILTDQAEHISTTYGELGFKEIKRVTKGDWVSLLLHHHN